MMLENLVENYSFETKKWFSVISYFKIIATKLIYSNR